MIIDGWDVRVDENDKIALRNSRQRPTHYLVTILNRYAIDIELLKEEVDKVPKNELQDKLIELIKGVIKNNKEPEWLGNGRYRENV